jgi:hypothetical protein
MSLFLMSLISFFTAPTPDPNAPKPEGSIMSPFPGEQLVVKISDQWKH